MPVVASASPSDAFDAALDAVRIAVTYRTPVLLLSDGAIANGSEPWRLPEEVDLVETPVVFATAPNGPDGAFLPYARDEETLGEVELGGRLRDAVLVGRGVLGTDPMSSHRSTAMTSAPSRASRTANAGILSLAPPRRSPSRAGAT